MIAALGKPLAEVTVQDIVSLVENHIPESRHLDYKEQLYDAGAKGYKEFACDAAAFANTDGGLLVFGVSEKRVGNEQTALPESIVGLPAMNPSAFARYEQSLDSAVAPRISGIDSRVLETPEGRSVLLVHVPRSWQAPHMVTADSLTRFYYRTASGRSVMDVEQIRSAFQTNASFNERTNELREHRLAHIASGQTPVQLGEGALVVVVNVVPSRSFDGVSLSMENLESARGVLQPLWGGGDFTWNIDGLLLAGDATYVQAFTSGMIEAADAALFKDRGAHGDTLRDALHGFLTRSIQWSNKMSVWWPVNVAVTLVHARGAKFVVGMRQIGAFDRDVIRVPLVGIRTPEPSDIKEAIEDILDAVSRAAGFKRFV